MVIGFSPNRKFSPGRPCISLESAQKLKKEHVDPMEFLARHENGDWGDITAKQAKENEVAIAAKGRILSVYETPKKTRVFCVTDAGHRETWVVLGEETSPLPESEIPSVAERLANSFPALAGCPGVDPWDPILLDQWAEQEDQDDAARLAAQFVLSVYNSVEGWMCGPFDVVTALEVWDETDWAVFREWVCDPKLDK